MDFKDFTSTDKKGSKGLPEDPRKPITNNNNINDNKNKYSIIDLCEDTEDYEPSAPLPGPAYRNFSNILLQSENSSCSTDIDDTFAIDHSQPRTDRNVHEKEKPKLLSNLKKYTDYNNEIYTNKNTAQVSELAIIKVSSSDSDSSEKSTVATVAENTKPSTNPLVTKEYAFENFVSNSLLQRDSRINLILPPKKRPRDPSTYTDTAKKPKISNIEEEGRKKKIDAPKGKYIKPPCKCIYKCYSKLDYHARMKISQQFWGLGDKQKQLDFLLNYTEKFKKIRCKSQNTSNSRMYTFKYKLPVLTKDVAINVCKKMFLNTLMINDKVLRLAWDNFEKCGNSFQIKTSDEHQIDQNAFNTAIKSVRDHVNSFTPAGSEYLGENITKLYLDGSLSMSRMFQLYNEWLDPKKYTRRAKNEKQYGELVKRNIFLDLQGLNVSNNDQYKETDFHSSNRQNVVKSQNINRNTVNMCEIDEACIAYNNENEPLVPCLTDSKEHFCRDHEQPSVEGNQYYAELNLASFNSYSEYHNHSLTSGSIKCNCLKKAPQEVKKLVDKDIHFLEYKPTTSFPVVTTANVVENVTNITPPMEKHVAVTEKQATKASITLFEDVKGQSQIKPTQQKRIVRGDWVGRTCKCIFKCYEKIAENERKSVYKKFHDLENKQKQYDFIMSLTQKFKNKKRLCPNLNFNYRLFTFKYKLPTAHGTTVAVCKRMFLNTLMVSDSTVVAAWEKHEAKVEDKEIKKIFKRRTVIKSLVKSVRDHVNTFIPIEAHFLGKKSGVLYLDGSLNISRMFKLYNEWLDPNKYIRRAKTEKKYRGIVTKNFNLGFHVIKKDECDQCLSFRKLDKPNDEQTARHIIHTQNIVTTHNKKNQDKLEATFSNGKVVTVTFDIEKLLPCPHGPNTSFDNKRKLLCFNLPILDMNSKRPVCYMWDECVGKNGANEVSSCLFNFVNSNAENGIEEFRFWSENDESRNHVIFSAYIAAAFIRKVNIFHSFHVQDHVQSDVAGVHAVIERISATKFIYTPEEWKQVVKSARTNCQEPYKVIDMTQKEFYDFESHLNKFKWDKDILGKPVIWKEVKEVFISSDNPSKIKFRYDFNQEYEVIDTKINKNSLNITRAYTKKILLSDPKYDDLLSLSKSGAIPGEYIKFYSQLPHTIKN